MSEQQSKVVDLEELQADQQVYGSDGKELGRVAGLTVDLESGRLYLEVQASPIPSYLGGQMLFVPESEIDYAVVGRPVILKVPADVARERFNERPNVI